MSSVIVRVGVAVAVGVAVYLYHWIRTRNNRIEDSSHSGEIIRNFDGSNINTCCICMEEFRVFADKNKIATLDCKHKFHKDCIKMVFVQGGSRTCPVCRSEVNLSYIHSEQFN